MELARLQRRNRGFVNLRIFLSWLSTSSSCSRNCPSWMWFRILPNLSVASFGVVLFLAIVNTHKHTAHHTTPQPPQYLVFYSTVFLVLPETHTRAWDVSSVTVPFLTHVLCGVNGLSFSRPLRLFCLLSFASSLDGGTLLLSVLYPLWIIFGTKCYSRSMKNRSSL